MRKYKDLLLAIRAVFPKAKDVIINIVTTDDEAVLFKTDLIEYIQKEGFPFIDTKDEVQSLDIPVDSKLGTSIQFDTIGSINLKTDI